jgi:hypothetical protein
MKKNQLSSYTLILIALTALYSCKKEHNPQVELQSRKESVQAPKPLVENGKLNLPVDSNGKYIFEGDIILSDEQAEFLIERGKKKSEIETQSTFKNEFVSLWPGGIVYYSIDADFLDRSRVTNAIATIQNSNSGVTFVERTNQPNYIQFKNTNDSTIGGSSELGMTGGQQIILISSPSNADTGSAIHEILHALGFFHEQSRADRNNYIVVYPQNIVSKYQSQFNTYLQDGINGIEIGTFDFDSIMLYPSTAFITSSGVYSMTKLDGSPFFAQRSHLSAGDIEGIRYRYRPIYIRRFFVLDEGASHNNVGPTDEDVHQEGDVTLKFYADANFTIPIVLSYPLKVKIVSYYTIFQQGSSSSASEMLVPAGTSEAYLGHTIYEYRSEYGTITSSYEEGVYVTPGVGYLSN